MPSMPTPFSSTAHHWYYVLVMIVLLPFTGTSQSLQQEELQQINRRLSESIADTARIRMLLALSTHAIAHADRTTARDSALRFAQEALTLSTNIGYDSGIVKSHLKEIAVWIDVRDRALAQKQDGATALEHKRAAQSRLIDFIQTKDSNELIGKTYTQIAHQYEGVSLDYAEMLALYDSAATYFRRSGNKMQESRALYAVGFNYNQLGKLIESLPIYHRSIELATPTGGMHLYRVYGILGNTYSLLGGYDIGLKYELKALELAEAAKDTTDEKGVLHLFLGLTYERLNEYTLAKDHFEKAYRIYQYYKTTSPGDFFSVSINLAKMMTLTNPQESIDFLTEFKAGYKNSTPPRTMLLTARFMQAYAGLHDYTKAQTYCRELIALAEAAPRPFLPAYMAISQFMIQSKQYRAAEKYLLLAEQKAREERRMPILQNIYLYWYKVDSAKGDYGAGMEKLKLHKAYSDSILNDTKAKEIALLQVEYEMAKKEQSIALLTKDSELDHQQLAQSRFQRNVILAGLAVTLLIIGLLFNQYRIKKNSNIELTHQQQQIQTTNEILQKTLLEKEWLLKEVHHRVKNNLQTVVSLLGSQLYSIQNREASLAIQDSQNRVYAMSLIHQKLYLTEHKASVDMADYLGELTEHLRDSLSNGRRIQFQKDIHAIRLDVSQAIPIGLILNEAITNVIKYAFPVAKENCRVIVSMQQDADGNISLTIADNGKGMPPDFDSSGNYLGMGLQLIHGLTSEIEGTCNVSSNKDNGVSIKITFQASLLLK